MICNQRCYSFYITTNSTRNVLYCGVTNDLQQRIIEHYLPRGNSKTFAGKCYCYWLVYFEHFKYINDAIARETEVIVRCGFLTARQSPRNVTPEALRSK